MPEPRKATVSTHIYREITPEHMAALAESASSAIELLEYGSPVDVLVKEGLQDAETFCAQLQNGIRTRKAPAKLSPTSVAQGELLELVFQISDQEELESQIPDVLRELSVLRQQKKRNRQKLEKLREFFYQFAVKLDMVGGLHRKLAAEID